MLLPKALDPEAMPDEIKQKLIAMLLGLSNGFAPTVGPMPVPPTAKDWKH
jgi:hypothetical protein